MSAPAASAITAGQIESTYSQAAHGSIEFQQKVIAIAQAISHSKTYCITDLAIGILVGRIYNSFHYQTRRILGRNATDKEFSEFVEIITARLDEMKNSIERK